MLIISIKMAGGRTRPVSSVLFCNEAGAAIHFFLRPSATKAELRPLIEDRGGVVRSKLDVSKKWIKLAAEGEEVRSNDYISVQYIHDCIAATELLPTEKYRVQQQPQPRSTSPAQSVISNVSIKGRSRYKRNEDDAILAYVAKHPRLSYSGNQIWKKMELLKVTDHSWQSMKYRFLKKLVDDLPRYVKARKKNKMDDGDTASEENGRDAENGHPSKPNPSPRTPSNSQREFHNNSSGSDSDFDDNLMREAEKHTPRKTTKATTQDTNKKTGHSDEGRPHESRKSHLRDPKVTATKNGEHSGSSRGLNANTAEDATDREMHSTKRRKKRPPPAKDADGFIDLTVSDLQLSGFVPEDKGDFGEDVDGTVSFVEKAVEDNSVTVKSVLKLLYIYSGDFASVLKHLQTGRQPKDVLLWTKEDDNKLSSCNTKDIKALCKKYGQEAVMKRQAFFD